MNKKQTQLLQLAFLISLIATAGSLFFSDVMKLPPCVLCWYQRVCMYPLVVVFGLPLVKNVKDSAVYGFTLSLIGFGIAVYHNLLYYKIIPDSITPCTQGISCTSRQIEWMGFITIPFLSLIAFLLLSIVCYLIFKSERSYEKQ
ncbi:disulfide oxidoreductase [Bdellovibrio sp. HCB274]|uniref:disulfide oxidoreductase n=1 Tax=Bdellovibrio sp. HCB274 TaxID=3394361 RepID=UPI0039B65C17